MDKFGPIFTGHTLEQATLDTLKMWLPTYLQEIELQLELPRGKLQKPRTYANRRRFDKFPEDQLPTVIAVCPGLAGKPLAEGDGMVRAVFREGVWVIASARTSEQTNMITKMYAAAIRMVLLQKGSLGGICNAVEWEDESYDDNLSSEEERTIGYAGLTFLFSVAEVALRWGGPEVPDPDTEPGTSWGEVETVIIDVVKEGAQ